MLNKQSDTAEGINNGKHRTRIERALQTNQCLYFCKSKCYRIDYNNQINILKILIKSKSSNNERSNLSNVLQDLFKLQGIENTHTSAVFYCQNSRTEFSLR